MGFFGSLTFYERLLGAFICWACLEKNEGRVENVAFETKASRYGCDFLTRYFAVPTFLRIFVCSWRNGF